MWKDEEFMLIADLIFSSSAEEKIEIVKTKRNIYVNKARAQCLLECQVLADVENLDEVYGIVTNWVDWAFSEARIV